MNSLSYICKKFEDLELVELYQILKVRQEVFIVEQNCPYLDTDNKDFNAYHFIGKDNDGNIQAYTRLLPIGVSYPDYISIGRVLTSMPYRNRGIGIELMQLSIQKIKEIYPTHPIKISAQEYLLKFYQNLGFIATDKYYLEDGIPHLEMIMEK